MLSSIISFSIKNKLVIGLMILGLIGYGIYQVKILPIDAVPDITDNQVQIITIAPSFGANDIERLVTFPLEQANSNIAGLKEIRSFSRFGLSLVTLVFDDATNVYWARQQVSERLQNVKNNIPNNIGNPELAPVTTGLGEIYQYVVKPKKGYENKFDAIALRTIQDNIIKRQLLGLAGVADVSSFGGKLKQYVIEVKPDILNAHKLTINDIFSAVENNNQNTGGAYIEKANTVLYIRSEGLIKNIEDIKNIPIINSERNSNIRLKDVANVTIGYATRYGAMCYNDEGEVSGAIVMMLKGANSSEVIKNVKERIIKIQQTLPEGIEIEPFLDRTKMVNNAINTVEKNLIEGALIVIFVLVIFLGNLRAGLIVASVIPLSMLFAISMMNLFGVSGNLMSLGALDFGLIVDGAVIIVESIMHQLHSTIFKGHNEFKNNEMDNIVKNSASKMMNSAVFGQIIILIVYLPIFTLEGIEGKMFKPMAQTVAFALIGAFILSLTYIPMISALLLSKKVGHKENISDKIINQITILYSKILIKILRIPKITLSAVLILFICSIFLLFKLGGEFIPELEEGDFAVDTRVLTGSNLNTTIEYTQKAAHALKKNFPEVEKIVTKIGSGEVPTDPMPMEASDMMVILKDKKEWKSAKTFNEMSEKMSKVLQEIPGITAGFQYPVQMRFNELMTGARQDIVCKIFGDNLDTLAVYANKLGKIANNVKGTKNLFIEPITGMPQIIIEYNRASIAQYNLSISNINKVINTAFAGQITGQVFEDEKRIDIVVKLDNSKRKQLEDVKNLLIPLPNGNQIPLAHIANVQIINGPNQIQREDAKRRIVVGFNIDNRDVQSIVEELKLKVENEIKLPSGYFINYGGSFENLEQAKKRLQIAVPISLLLIFILLYMAFNSFKQTFLIYSAIPLSAIGGIISLSARGMPFSISAGIGFIALFGVSVLNGIVLITEFNRIKKSGNFSLSKIVVMGTKLRIRPVLMTAFVASLGFLPMALSNGAGAEVQRPLATVVIGGLLLSTFLTLFVLPILFIITEKGLFNAIKLKNFKFVILFVFIAHLAFAQQKITLNEALKLAIQNNNEINNEKLKTKYAEILINTAIDIPKTNFSSEFGQINNELFDSKFTIAQNIGFPIIYKRHKNILIEEWKTDVLKSDLKTLELKKNLTAIFFNIIYLKEKRKILLTADSLYNIFHQKTIFRLEKGESSILEKSTAEIQLRTINIQLKELNNEIENLLMDLQLLLNTNTLVEPISDNLKLEKPIIIDTLSIYNHHEIKILENQKKQAVLNTLFEKSKLLPDINIGYTNNSFQEISKRENSKFPKNRFSSLLLGIDIPIFNFSQKSRINASKLNEKIAENSIEIEKQKKKTYLKQLLNKWDFYQKEIDFFESLGLKNASTITKTATIQFNAGEINYIDYVFLLNQSLIEQSNYIEIIEKQNQITILINHLFSN
jgi:cobalt-zinc-cadmium resistance protein CzcA